eukprot:14385378-Alexandrium_andersonii.AAC.1
MCIRDSPKAGHRARHPKPRSRPICSLAREPPRAGARARAHATAEAGKGAPPPAPGTPAIDWRPAAPISPRAE